MTTTCLWAHLCPKLNTCPSSPEHGRAAGPHCVSPRGQLGPAMLNGAVPKAATSPSSRPTKMGQQRVPRIPREPKVAAGDGRAGRRREGRGQIAEGVSVPATGRDSPSAPQTEPRPHVLGLARTEPISPVMLSGAVPHTWVQQVLGTCEFVTLF